MNITDPTPEIKSTTDIQNDSPIKSFFASIVMVLAFVVSVVIYIYVLGNASNFEGGNNANHPLPGNYLGIIYKGGPVVPFLIAINLIVLIFSIERFLTIKRAQGKGSLDTFVRKLKGYMATNQISEAIAECDRHQGSLANVMRAGLNKYGELQNDNSMVKDQKVLAMQKELEEATALELPMLSKNLVIVSTMASISTLVGLIGTVLGMVKAFAALAQAGAPDAVALANGISEALINTALGILGSTLAIIAYNYFSSSIDNLTYKIDEAGFSLVQTFASKNK